MRELGPKRGRVPKLAAGKLVAIYMLSRRSVSVRLFREVAGAVCAGSIKLSRGQKQLGLSRELCSKAVDSAHATLS